MKLPTLPLCAILAGAYPLPISRKDSEEPPPGEERFENNEPAPPPKPEETIIKLARESAFFGQTLWTERDRGPDAFYTHLYRQNGRRKRRPRRR